MKTYNFKQFDSDFPDDAACLEFIFWNRWPNGGKCECGKVNSFYRVAKRRCYACAFFVTYKTAHRNRPLGNIPERKYRQCVRTKNRNKHNAHFNGTALFNCSLRFSHSLHSTK